jgi:putative sporulation protein YyaC
MNLPVVICIGSASVLGDSLGPLVGDLLRDKYNVKAYVYGGVRQPVNGINYGKYLQHIKQQHSESFVFAVDACVGDGKDIGKIKISTGGVTAGGALNKNFARVGDIGILGVVAERQNDNLSALMAVSYSTVDQMSAAIAKRLASVLVGFELLFAKAKRNS